MVELCEAAKALCDKLVAVHNSSEYIGVWVVYQTHCGQYIGPNYGRELKALQDVLKKMGVSIVESQEKDDQNTDVKTTQEKRDGRQDD